MNLGIQDAANLAWKVALVVKGRARPSLLDSYEAERRAIAKGVVTGTDRATRAIMRVMALRNPLAVALRSQAVSFVAELGFVQDRAPVELSGMRVGYSGSPIVGEQHSSVFTAELGERCDERPTLGDWMSFSQGPGPGQRVPDLDLPAGCEAATLHELLLGTSHHLFLFDGAAATTAGYANLDAIAERVEQRLGDGVRIHVVVPAGERPAALRWRGRLILDREGDLHAHFGCGSEGLYLVRPDGYVAFRAQPADQGALLRYLEMIFT
jgi:hypothetical protein